MDKNKLSELYMHRGYSKEKTAQAINAVLKLEEYLVKSDVSLENCTVGDIKKYISQLAGNNQIDMDTILAMARYFYLENSHDIYIYFTKLVGGLGVLENIKSRAEKYAGKEAADKVFDGFSFPPLGTPIEEVPAYTKELMRRIEKNLPPELYKKILAGNNHGVPAESMQSEKSFYEKAESLEQYLKERHERKVAELQQYCDAGRVWFEQEITQPVVDFVKTNQEILSAVKKGYKLYVTKIPYDTVGFLNAKSDKEKNYYACHCTFAREAILSDKENVPSDWCYCSAGFAKFPFEVILGRELNVRLLNSALDGDGFCRFEIDLEKSES
jgi:hypothetical protein